MKKTITSLLACFVFGAATLFAGEPVVKTGDAPAKKTQTYTFKELKAKYGENLIIESGTYQDDDLIEVQTEGPGDCHGQPCEAAIRVGVAQAQKEANDCCCSFAMGIICCQNGAIAEYLILIEPTVTCP